MRLKIRVILLIFLFAGTNASAATIKERVWSFEFSDIPVSNALNKISKASGIQIILDGNTSNMHLTKSYKNYTIESILIDIFRGENLAALFHYNEQKISSINIWILPKVDSMNKKVVINKSTLNRKFGQGTSTLPQQGFKKTQESGIRPEQSETGIALDSKRNPFTAHEEKSNFDTEAEKINPFLN
jgi:hypothetical protein